MKHLLALALAFLSLSAFAQNGGSTKLSYPLQQALQRRAFSDSLTVSVSVLRLDEFLPAHLIRLHFRKGSSLVVGRTRMGNLQALAESSNVLFINEVLEPKEELTTGAFDLSLNRISFVHSRLPALRGDSVSVSVKERLFDTTDIDLVNRVFRTGLENNTQTSHASLMATILAGAANTSPFARGVASRARVSSASFLNLFPDTDSLFQFYRVSVQNHSYGTAVENFYGNEAAAYDQSTVTNNKVVQVFSAGNSGTVTNTSGPYANIPQVANLSGNFKQAKNIITVSATDSTGQVMPQSSRGPAYDGRVKPELTAYGEDGSSGAAALASGVATLVQDAYKKQQLTLPPAALVKAVLLNAADDAGEKNVDYQYGYGNLNAWKAVQTITEQRYLQSTVLQNEIKSFPINVPQNTQLLKLTLAWTDPAAAPNAPKALVQDLDQALIDPSMVQVWLPWVLDPSPNAATLALPAQRKKDTLNNVEQITVENPGPGAYMLQVKGTKVTGTQAFSLAWQFDTAGKFSFVYPTATDHLIAANTHTVRWETTLTGSAQLQYSANGTNWFPAAFVSDLSKKQVKWTLPDTLTTARLRLTSGSTDYFSDSFTISRQPKLQVGFNCIDSFLLYWNALPVSQYQLYALGQYEMQPLLNTADTSVLLRRAQHPAFFYSVAPVMGSRQGIRSNTVDYTAQSATCYILGFFLQTQTATSASFAAQLGTLFQVTEVRFEKWMDGQFQSLQTSTPPAQLQFSFTDNALVQGENRYRFAVKLANGLVIYSGVETVYHLTDAMPVVLYPNPAVQGNQLKVITAEVGRYRLLVYDATGRLLKEIELNNGLTFVNTGGWSKGLYLVQVIDSRGSPTVQKLVIQ